jgi:hypothetical protein
MAKGLNLFIVEFMVLFIVMVFREMFGRCGCFMEEGESV